MCADINCYFRACKRFFSKTDSHYQMGSSSNKYAACGVDIDAGSTLIQMIKPLVKRTYRSGCIAELGSFGGLFDLRACNFNDPILVAGTDGVGTKLKVQFSFSKQYFSFLLFLFESCCFFRLSGSSLEILLFPYKSCLFVYFQCFLCASVLRILIGLSINQSMY